MYNAFNQQFIGGPGGPGFNTWPPAGSVAPGNPQAGGMTSFPHPYGGFPGNPGMMGPGMPFGMMPPQQAGWHAVAAQQQFQQQQQHQYHMQQQQQQHMFHQQQQQQQQMGYDYQGQTAYGNAPPQAPISTGSADDAPPPLPDGEPPPLPPPSNEDPPPLPPPDASGSAPPLPPGPGPPQQPQNPVAANNTGHQGTTPRPGTAQAAAAAPQGAWPGHSYPQALNWSGPGAIHAHPHDYPPPYGMPQYDPYMAPYGAVQPPPTGPYAPAAAVPQPPLAAGPPAAASVGGSGPTPPPQPLEAPVVDITRLLRPPHRDSRPRKLLLLLRGLPGSGKSTLARKIREAEAEAGAEAPRVHSMDDYYMQEVEVEVAEEDASGRKKRRKVTEMKYVYEPEMEGAYFRELVRAVGRSVEDRRHSFVVVDAPLLRLEQLRELLVVGQRANFSCVVLRPLETDPSVCASSARNVHGHSPEALRAMAAQYEEAPPLYEQVSAVSLFGGPVVGEPKAAKAGGGDGAGSGGGDDGGDGGIQEVDMDADDDDSGDAADGDGDAAAAAAGGMSRWGAADGSDDGSSGRGERKRKKKKRMQAAVELVDDEGILSGLRDALGAAAEGGRGEQGGGEGQVDGGAAATVNGGTGHGVKRRVSQPSLAAVGPLKSALRRVSSEPAVATGGGGGGGEAATPQGAGAGRERRRVWWPDLGPGGEAKEEEEDNASVGADSPGNAPQPSPLVDVVVLEGLGPPPELEDLPYGYQRKTLAGPRRPDQGLGAMGHVVQQAGGAAAAGGAAGGHGSLSAADHHLHFREQAKAEHESEHDLFRHLLLGKRPNGAGAGQDGWGAQTGGAAGPGTGSGGTPLGLFARAADLDEEEDT